MQLVHNKNGETKKAKIEHGASYTCSFLIFSIPAYIYISMSTIFRESFLILMGSQYISCSNVIQMIIEIIFSLFCICTFVLAIACDVVTLFKIYSYRDFLWWINFANTFDRYVKMLLKTPSCRACKSYIINLPLEVPITLALTHLIGFYLANNNIWLADSNTQLKMRYIQVSSENLLKSLFFVLFPSLFNLSVYKIVLFQIMQMNQFDKLHYCLLENGKWYAYFYEYYTHKCIYQIGLIQFWYHGI